MSIHDRDHHLTCDTAIDSVKSDCAVNRNGCGARAVRRKYRVVQWARPAHR